MQRANYAQRYFFYKVGWIKHIEHMDKARQAKRDKEEREKKVFINGDNWSRDNLVTIPKPFNLSYVITF